MFTSSLIGGMLIGVAAVWFLLSTGRVAGISGIAGRALNSLRAGRPREVWPWLFIAGLGIGGWLAYAITGERTSVPVDTEMGIYLVIGGVLVGVGTRMGSGCTSGHGVCGMSRFSKRSIVATLIYLSVGVVTATLVQQLGALA